MIPSAVCVICGKDSTYMSRAGHPVCSLKCEMEVIGLTDPIRNHRVWELLVEAREALRACRDEVPAVRHAHTMATVVLARLDLEFK